MALFGTQPRVHPYFGYRNETRLSISLRALRSRETSWDHESTFTKMRALWRHFASREVARMPVTLEARCRELTTSATCTTGPEGYCHFTIDLDGGWTLPERTSWETVTLRWTIDGSACEAPGYVLAPARANKLAVISDIDDTIMETGAHNLVRNWRRVLAQMPGERLPVPGASEFYARLGGQATGAAMPATNRPFFYVSSSPWNLFDYLVAFQRAHGLPHGPMFLRDWGFNRSTLGRKGHGAHKTAAIGSLAGFYPATRFALIGDSTQADAIAYADSVETHTGQIAGVLIRKAPGATVDPDERLAFDRIEKAGVPLWVGESFEVQQDFLAALGLAEDTEAKTVAEKAVSPADASAPVQSASSL